MIINAFGINVDDDALTAKPFRCFLDEIWITYSGGVNGDFVTAGIQKVSDVIESFYPAPDGLENLCLCLR